MFHVIPMESVQEVWPTIKHWLSESKIFSTVEENVLSGKYKLLTTDTGCAVVSMLNNQTLFIVELGGKELVTQDLFNELKVFAKSVGATKVQAMAKPSAARLYKHVGMHTAYELMECDL